MRQTIWPVLIVPLITLTAPISFGAEEIKLSELRRGKAIEIHELYLDVYVNDRPRNLIAEFRFSDDGDLQSRAGELRDIGIQIPEAIPNERPLRDCAIW